MSKRPTIDLLALTSEPAAPMAEAVQRIPSTAGTAIAAVITSGWQRSRLRTCTASPSRCRRPSASVSGSAPTTPI